MVKCVESLRTELQPYPLPEPDVLENAQVELVEDRAPFSVACCITERGSEYLGGAGAIYDVPHIIRCSGYPCSAFPESVHRIESVLIRERGSKDHERIYLADRYEPVVGVRVADKCTVACSQVGVEQTVRTSQVITRRVRSTGG